MLSAIKEIGDLVSTKAISSDRRIEGKILAIVLNDNNSAFQEIGIEDYMVKNEHLYLQSRSKGRDTSPFLPLSNKNPEKSYEKIARWFKKCAEIKENKELIEKINKVLIQEKESILSTIRTKSNDLPKKDKTKFLTLKLDGGRKFVGEHDTFRKAVCNFAKEKINKSSASNKVCSVCGEPQDNVSARTFVYQFDTDDKPGFIAGGFNTEHNWKNIPVCEVCRDLLKRGREFIDSKLNFKFYGLSYSLIPRMLTGNKEVLTEIINILSDTSQSISLKERIKKRITSDENEILEFIADKKDILSLNFLFLQKQNSAERILLLIENVFPSRIRAIFNAKDEVDSVFNEDFTFGRIRTFFSKSDEGKRKSDLNKYFLEIVDAVFKGRWLDFSFLAKFHMNVIRREFVNEGFFTFRVKDTMMNTMFFENLGLINFGEGKDMEEGSFDSIFSRYGKSLNSSEKRGIFLLGVLTQMLLNKQYADRKAKPFMKKLKSLKMGERDIIALMPEVQNKLEEYDSFDKGKRAIASEASKYLLAAGDGWKISVDEINFHFACGMNLIDDIAKVVYPKENNLLKEN
jgi:CRISPR-associated protein Csh1